MVLLFLQKRPDPVREKVCELVQVWSHAFRSEHSYKIVVDMYNLMRNEGKFYVLINVSI